MTANALRICFVSHTGDLSGAERSMLTLMGYLQQAGHQVFAVLPFRGPMMQRLEKLGVEHKVMPFNWWASTPAVLSKNKLYDDARAIAAQMKEWRAQIAYTNTSVIHAGAIAAMFAGIPHVWHQREFVCRAEAYRFPDPPATVFRTMAAFSNAIICTSNVLASEHPPENQPKVYPVHNFVQVDHPLPDPPTPADVQVDVVLPFHNDPTTIECMRSLVRHRTPTLGKVLVIDDGSSKTEAIDPVKAYIAEHPDLFVYSKHDTAQGFVRTVNDGMRTSTRDVVLLNTDTLVTAGWLDRLAAVAYSQPEVATVTPMSNNASIFSVPAPVTSNPVEDLDATARIVAQVAPVPSMEVFTGHGFCLYIRRAAIDRVGVFDAEKYGTGYCEENDYSMRASKAGMKNLIACRAFVMHRGAGSFGSERRQRLIAQNRAKLVADFPEYDGLVKGWLAYDPLKDVQGGVAAFQHNPKALDEPKVVIVGAVIPTKAQHHAAEALALLHRDGVKAHLVIVGPVSNVNYVNQVKELIQTHGLGDYVHFSGFVHNAARLIQMADVTIVARADESFGRVTVESMLLGTPVVAARGGGNSELIEDGVTGLLYEGGNVQDLAAKLACVLKDHQAREQMIDKARASCSRFSLEGYGGGIAKILADVINQPTPMGKLGVDLGHTDAGKGQQELNMIKSSRAWKLIEKSWRLRNKLGI
jgi:glycosyltransferase involved in cell wall biosynthesis